MPLSVFAEGHFGIEAMGDGVRRVLIVEVCGSLVVFALAGLLAFFIAFMTAGFQAVRAALANPAESLRHE